MRTFAQQALNPGIGASISRAGASYGISQTCSAGRLAAEISVRSSHNFVCNVVSGLSGLISRNYDTDFASSIEQKNKWKLTKIILQNKNGIF